MPVFLFLIFVCLISCFFSCEQLPLKLLLPAFFAVLLVVESVCYYYQISNKNNTLIYNLWFPVEFSFYSFWVACYLSNRYFKQSIVLCIFIYLSICGLMYIQKSDLYKFNTLAFQLGVVLLIPVLLYKLYEFINESVIINPFRNALFWLISGLLISSLGSFFQFSVENYLLENHKDVLFALRQFNVLLTDVLYCCIIAYFILSWRMRLHH
jgi:Sec-independent protein secretion pathway component TatC